MSITYFFYKIYKNILDSLRENFGANYIVAGIATYELVRFGFDIAWYRFALYYHWIYTTGFISAILGLFIPVFVPLGLYLYGLTTKKKSTQITGLAIGQAAFLGLIISTFIKVFTGRIPPGAFVGQTLGGFQFGFLRGGAFNGWPSSHTTVAFATAAALITLYPKNKAVRIGAITFAIIIGLGVSVNIHWFSDVIAGALIGWAIGVSVGRSFTRLI